MPNPIESLSQPVEKTKAAKMAEQVQRYIADHLPQLQVKPELYTALRRVALSLMIAGGLSLAVACNEGTPKAAAQSTPTELATPTLEPTTPETATDGSPSSEIAADAAIAISGIIQEVPGNPGLEAVNLAFPPEITSGNYEVLAGSETIGIHLLFESSVLVEKVQLSLNSLLGPDLGQDVLLSFPAKAPGKGMDGDEIVAYIEAFLGPKGITLSEEAKKLFLEEAYISLSTLANQPGKYSYGIKLELPNQPLTFTVGPNAPIAQGVHLAQPALNFFKSPRILFDRQFGNSPTAKVGFSVGGEIRGNNGGVVLIDEFEISPFGQPPAAAQEKPADDPNVKVIPVTPTATLEAPATQPKGKDAQLGNLLKKKGADETGNDVTPTPTATPKIIHSRSGENTDQRGTVHGGNTTESQVGSESDELWTKEWEPDVTVTLRQWWDDMVARGYIVVDSLARQYGGDILEDRINTYDLVPNPVDYRNKGFFFIGSCQSKLDEIVTVGQGHITISSQAFALIPGGENCQMYGRHK